MAARLGVIADTHGQLPSSVAGLFEGVERIIHAGDVGTLDVLVELGGVAPVLAVRGNVDDGETACLPQTARLEVEGVRIRVQHRPPGQASLGTSPDGLVIAGHTHQACVVREGGVTYVNPGSPVAPRGERRSVVMVEVDGARVSARIVRF